MKKIAAVFIVLLFLLAPAVSFAGAPYAPKVKPPSSIKQGSVAYFGVMMVNAAVVPDKAVVEVPPYPGAKVVSTSSGMEMTVNDEKLTCFHSIKLLSTDTLDKVIEFYKKELGDYKFKSQFGGIINVFWKSSDEYNPMDITQSCRTPNVSMLSESGNELMPEAKTMIDILYLPNK